MIRFLLILVIMFLLVRYIAALARPRRTEERVKGHGKQSRIQINEDRIEEAEFKDISKDK
jgi:large-conductance mechanosensitive channel